MKSILSTTVFCFMIILLIKGGMASSNQEEKIVYPGQKLDIGPPGPNEVLVGPNGMIMPLGRILLVSRKNLGYCAIKFTKFWIGKSENDKYATYESYYQNDGIGDFTDSNVKFRKEELHWPLPSRLIPWFIFGHAFVFGAKEEIKCGPIKLWWTGKGAVYFFEKHQAGGDHGIEFAPTKWTDISQVNVFDPKLKWYRYDEKRERVNIPVEQLW